MSFYLTTIDNKLKSDPGQHNLIPKVFYCQIISKLRTVQTGKNPLLEFSPELKSWDFQMVCYKRNLSKLAALNLYRRNDKLRIG